MKYEICNKFKIKKANISLPVACFCRNLFSTDVESNPALSHSCRGIISRALAKADIISCSFPAILLEYSRRYLLSSISMAPPPATTASFYEKCMCYNHHISLYDTSQNGN